MNSRFWLTSRFLAYFKALPFQNPALLQPSLLSISSMAITKGSFSAFALDGKTVHIFAYSSTREQSNKWSGTRLKTESETGERRLSFLFRSTARDSYATLYRFLYLFWEKTTVLQCTFVSVTCFLNIAVELKHETLDVCIYVYTNLNVRVVRECLLPTIRARFLERWLSLTQD